MARKRFTAEQIIMKLREAEVGLAQGQTVGQVCKQIGVTEQTYYRWRKEYGGLRLNQAKRLKVLEKEECPVEEASGRSVFGQADPKGSFLGKLLGPTKRRRAVGVGEGEIGSRARLRTSGLPSAGTGSIDPAKGKAYPR